MYHKGVVLVAAVLFYTSSLHAQTCSGGADGGMDATGCDCNAPQVASGHVDEETRKSHYVEATRHLRRAADLGDSQAARMLALMDRADKEASSRGSRGNQGGPGADHGR